MRAAGVDLSTTMMLGPAIKLDRTTLAKFFMRQSDPVGNFRTAVRRRIGDVAANVGVAPGRVQYRLSQARRTAGPSELAA
jgi:hypothetical protein